MKKTFLFLAALCFCAFVNKAVGQTWSLNNGTLVISGDDAFSTDPYPWAGRTGEITKLSIGSGVTSIPGSAFSDCTGLTDVTLEDGTTALSFNGSSDQFSNCPIKTFYWGRNLVQYGSPCSNKATLTLVTFGANVSSIGDNDFSNCTGLTSVTIPSSIISIGDWAFYYCSSLKSITFPGSIASIGYSAFQYSGLTSVSIPNNITSIYSSAFADCTGLTDVTLEDGATVLSFNGSDQFSNCPIKTFYWGRNLGQYSSPCGGKATLTSVTFGANVSSIGDHDFENCTGLTSVTISNSITSIGDWAFYYCSSLKSITFPGSIASIGYSAFQYSGLTSVSIPNNITSIYSSAFADCTGLTDVTLEDGATVLSFNDKDQFSNCPIKTLYLGRNLVQYNSLFIGTTLTTLTIGGNVTSINDNAFAGCVNLAQITSNPTTPPTIGSNTFYGVKTNIPIHIDCNYLAAYKLEPYWSDFTNYQCKSNDATLSSLTVSQGTLTPAFDPNTTDYTVDVTNDVTSITIYPTLTNSTATVNTNGPEILSVGNNKYTIVVTAEDGTTHKTYTVVVNRAKDTGINNIESSDITIFPNPAHSEIFIKSDLKINSVEIYSLTGSLLLLENSFNGKIAISALPKGIYMLKIYTDNGLVVRKIMKE